LATWAWKRAAWSSASFSSLKPLAYSRPVMKSSKRSVTAGLASLARASGLTSTG
jgi:ABC-type arginine/histidine transport system permease subunit